MICSPKAISASCLRQHYGQDAVSVLLPWVILNVASLTLSILLATSVRDGTVIERLAVDGVSEPRLSHVELSSLAESVTSLDVLRPVIENVTSLLLQEMDSAGAAWTEPAKVLPTKAITAMKDEGLKIVMIFSFD